MALPDAFLCGEGLARFATIPYRAPRAANLNDKFMHLTNYSLNKNNPEFKRAEGDADDEGHKWSARAVWAHLEKQGVDTAPIKDKIDGIPRLIVSRRVCVGVVCARWQEQMSSRRVLLASPCCLLLRRLHLRGARRDLVDQT